MERGGGGSERDWWVYVALTLSTSCLGKLSFSKACVSLCLRVKQLLELNSYVPFQDVSN